MYTNGASTQKRVSSDTAEQRTDWRGGGGRSTTNYNILTLLYAPIAEGSFASRKSSMRIRFEKSFID